LLNNTKTIYVEDNSKKPEYENVQGYTGSGWFMISKINGNYLFFPETGIKGGDKFSDNDASGIWLSHVSTGSKASKCNCADTIKFKRIIDLSYVYGYWKYQCIPIRPVVNL